MLATAAPSALPWGAWPEHGLHQSMPWQRWQVQYGARKIKERQRERGRRRSGRDAGCASASIARSDRTTVRRASRGAVSCTPHPWRIPKTLRGCWRAMPALAESPLPRLHKPYRKRRGQAGRGAVLASEGAQRGEQASVRPPKSGEDKRTVDESRQGAAVDTASVGCAGGLRD